MSDKEILDIFITKKGKINPNLCRDRWLDKHLDIKEYLDSQKVNDRMQYGDIVGYIALRNNVQLNVSKSHGIAGIGDFHKLKVENGKVLVKEPDEYTDEIFKDLIATKNKSGEVIFDVNVIKNLDKKPKLKEYLENRFSDSRSMKETIYRIYYGFEEIPKCKICRRPTSFSGRHWKVYNAYCSLNCKNEDKDIMYSTKQEDSCYKLLCESFGAKNIERQYQDKRYHRSDGYLYKCDFYIKDRDVFIELQGFWTHGRHPFDETNINDIKRLEKLKERGKEKEIYLNAIDVWTKFDVEKRTIAKQNYLNYIEIFDYEFISKEKLVEYITNKYHIIDKSDYSK